MKFMLSHDSIGVYLMLMRLVAFLKELQNVLETFLSSLFYQREAQNLQFINRVPLAENVYLQDLKYRDSG